MNSIDTLATFFGWCTVINIGLLVFGGLMWIVAKERFSELGAKVFGVTKEEAKVAFLGGLTQYRAAMLILNLVPFLALKIMA